MRRVRERTAIGVHPDGLDRLQGILTQLPNGEAFEAVALDRGLRADKGEWVEILWRRQPDRTAWMRHEIERLTALRWVHTDVVGVERFPLRDLARRRVLLTNGAGVLSRTVAEWVLWSLLTASRAALDVTRASQDARWEIPEPARGLDGARILILGGGAIGTTVAELLRPFRAEVRIARRRDGPAWRDGLAVVDYLVVAVPLTASTRGIVGHDVLAALPPTAWLIDVSRGGVVDERPLLRALDRRRLAGAVLDVFEQEPLPAAHPLWSRPNVVVLPHTTGRAAVADELHAAHFGRQLERWARGETPHKPVDLHAGY
jgi:phosphoglycerate dehydrogenase-like enzyme